MYDLEPEEYLRLDLSCMPPEDLHDLAYFIWCCYDDDAVLMEWREKLLLPYINKVCPKSIYAEAEEEDEEGDFEVIDDES